MPRLSLGLGVQAVRKVKAGGPPPSGIPVASTSNILITRGSLILEPYSRLFISDAVYKSTLTPDDLPILAFNWLSEVPNIWVFTEYDGDGGYTYYSTNPSSNGAYIPTSGWTGIPFTITAV